jgi:hypothetical protein
MSYAQRVARHQGFQLPRHAVPREQADKLFGDRARQSERLLDALAESPSINRPEKTRDEEEQTRKATHKRKATRPDNRNKKRRLQDEAYLDALLKDQHEDQSPQGDKEAKDETTDMNKEGVDTTQEEKENESTEATAKETKEPNADNSNSIIQAMVEQQATLLELLKKFQQQIPISSGGKASSIPKDELLVTSVSTRKKTLLTAVLFGLGADVDDSDTRVATAVKLGFQNWVFASTESTVDIESIADLADILRVRILYTFSEKGKKKILTYPMMDLSAAKEKLPTVSIERIEDGLNPYKTSFAKGIDKLPTDDVAEIRNNFLKWIISNASTTHFFYLLDDEQQLAWLEDDERETQESEEMEESENKIDQPRSTFQTPTMPLMIINKSIPMLSDYKDFCKANDWVQECTRFYAETRMEHVHPSSGMLQPIYKNLAMIWKENYSEAIDTEKNRERWFPKFLELLRGHLNFRKSQETITISKLKDGTLDYDDLANQVDLCVLALPKDQTGRITISQDMAIAATIIRKVSASFEAIGALLEHRKDDYKSQRLKNEQEAMTKGQRPEAELYIYQMALVTIAAETQQDRSRLSSYFRPGLGYQNSGSDNAFADFGKSNGRGERKKKLRAQPEYKRTCLQCKSTQHLLKDCPQFDTFLANDPTNKLALSIKKEKESNNNNNSNKNGANSNTNTASNNSSSNSNTNSSSYSNTRNSNGGDRKREHKHDKKIKKLRQK